MFRRYCTWAILLALSTTAQAQEAAAPRPIGYTVFLKGTPIGREDVTVRVDASGVSILSQGRMSVPSSITTRRAEVKYSPDWTPQTFNLEASVNGGDVTARSTFEGSVARTSGAQTGTPYSREHAISPQAVVLLPSSFFGAFEAVSRQLVNAPGGTELKAYVLPQGETTIKLVSSVAERIQIGKDVFDVRHFEVLWQIPGTPDIGLSITSTKDGGLVRFSVPSQGLDVVRADVAASTSRTQVYSNAGDEAVTIPALGFNLGATITRPAAAAAGTRIPAVILIGGAGSNDRDGAAHGVPTLSHLAAALAKAGYLAVRYDKRGFGQSGGRAESATLTDYAEDVRAVVRWLNDRKDVDPKRIAVAGHGEGAWVALLAASRERKLAAVVSLAGPGSTGADLVLDQQQRALEAVDAHAGGPRGPGGAAEADSRGGALGQRLGGRTAQRAQGSRHAVDAELPDVRSRQDDRWRAAADALRPRSARSSGGSGQRRTPRGTGPYRQQEQVGRARRGARRQPPADAGRHRRGERVREPRRPHRQQGRDRGGQHLAGENLRRHPLTASRRHT